LRAHEPDVFARVRKVVMPKDWVGYRLTGELATDVSDASGTLAFDPAARAWSREMLDAMGIDGALFPEARESIVPLGVLASEAARRAGMPAGTIVVRGGADNAAAAVGLGVVREGRAMASIGTSGVVLAHTDALHTDDALRLHAFSASVPDASYSMGVMLSAGGALRWYRDTMCPGSANRSYEELTALAALAKPGAGGVVFLPYLMGERTPHNDASARAAFVGMSASTSEADLARAVLEGVAFGLADSLALMHTRPTELRATGGGARSAVWRQLIADVLDVSVATTTSTEGPAFGAALLAGVGVNVWDSVNEGADALVTVVDRAPPDPSRAALYREIHAVYRALYEDLRPRLRALAALTHET
jgi:xylulokinase